MYILFPGSIYKELHQGYTYLQNKIWHNPIGYITGRNITTWSFLLETKVLWFTNSFILLFTLPDKTMLRSFSSLVYDMLISAICYFHIL